MVYDHHIVIFKPVVQRAKAEALEYWAANKGSCINYQPSSIVI